MRLNYRPTNRQAHARTLRLRREERIKDLVEKWHPIAARALQAFAPLFEGKLEDAQMPPLERVTQKIDKYYRDYLSSMGLQPAISCLNQGLSGC